MKNARANSKTSRRTKTRKTASNISTSSRNVSTLTTALAHTVSSASSRSRPSAPVSSASFGRKTSYSRTAPSTAPSVAQKRSYTLGQHYAKVNAEATLQKKAEEEKIGQERRAASHEAYLQREEARQKRQPSAFELKTKLITAVDQPQSKARQQEVALQTAADSKLNFSPPEVSVMLNMCSISKSRNAKAAAVLVQDLIQRDLVPEESSLRGLARLFEANYQWESAHLAIDAISNLYPPTQYDELGFPLPKEVLTRPLPDFTKQLDEATVKAQPTNIDALNGYIAALKVHGLTPRYETLHFVANYHLHQKNLDKAGDVLFKMFSHLGLHTGDGIPQPFDAVEFHAHRERTSGQFRPDIDLYYRMADAFVATKNWAAAMQILIFTRDCLRHLDVTPLREVTSAGYHRDFLDLHMHSPDQVKYVVRQLLAELRVRRGYKHDMEKKTTGSESAKSFIQYTPEHHMTYSPLISTTNQRLVVLTDRVYNHRKDVIEEKGGIENTNAHALHKALSAAGVESKICLKGSEYSGSSEFYLKYKPLNSREQLKAELNPDPILDEHGNVVTQETFLAKENERTRDITVMVHAEELDKYGDYGVQLYAERWSQKAPSLPNVSVPMLSPHFAKPRSQKH